ncbi:hypothetical protein FISHEDRAFT_39803 [Fistulina hepatica ATCC 64428]|uniref:Uncharacterized protein n=1 Tax=Fistulina hepatica ATCC 64428 TaxID=1128425 RepID=A0A0D7AIW0_9AGAR|nr:hypothetical protein FISHEDRAFT_39803 [Fistulina hepatica ATCC 64428]
MPKLRLKRTPEEELAHQLKKRRKEERRLKRKHSSRLHDDADIDDPCTSQRHEHRPRIPPNDDDCDDSYISKHEYERIQAQAEEDRFREKLFDAMADDERLDDIETRFNYYAHIPSRWRSANSKGKETFYEEDSFLRMNPDTIEDEEDYAEWIRLGMYRKTHAAEYEEQERVKAAKAARKAAEDARRAETARMVKVEEFERLKKKKDAEMHRWDYARQCYASRWAELSNAPPTNNDGVLAERMTFANVPWPVVSAYPISTKKGRQSPSPSITVADLTLDAISTFLLPSSSHYASPDDPNVPSNDQMQAKARKEQLRETFLRFHPDKFESRTMKLVKSDDQEQVREGISHVVRALNTLMSGD